MGVLEFALLENGIDFIHRALECLSGKSDARDLKYGILHLSAGIEIVFKERLRREHWSLVFCDIDKANEEALERGDFKSIYLHSSLKRLHTICGIELSKEEKAILNNLRDRRNKIEHFTIEEDLESVKSITAKAVNLILNFIRIELKETTEDNEQLKEIFELSLEYTEFVDHRLETLQLKIDKEERTIFICPKCLQETLVLDDVSECLFCNYSGTSENVAEDIIHSVLGISWRHLADGGEWPLHNCPGCESESLINLIYAQGQFGNMQFICLTCGSSWDYGDLDDCSSCGKIFDPGEHRNITCGDCFAYILAKND